MYFNKQFAKVSNLIYTLQNVDPVQNVIFVTIRHAVDCISLNSLNS
jgi:hypothetical protein